MFEFTVAFRHLDFEDDDAFAKLEGVGHGATWFARDGEVLASVTVEASDPIAAVLTVERQVKDIVAGAQATRVLDDLVAIPDIASRVGVDREAVRHWVNGTRGPGGFPRPLSVVGDRVKVWDWPTVNEWLRRRLDRAVDSNRLLTQAEIARANQVLAPLPDQLAVGVGLTPDALKSVLTDHTGAVLASAERAAPTPGTPEQIATAVAAVVADSVSAHGTDGVAVPLGAIGIHVGGHVNHAGRVVLAPQYQERADWTKTDLQALVERETGIPTVVQNDANALALYERYRGVGTEARSFVVIYLSDGVGAGIVTDGQLMTGWQGAAGEIGHLVVALGGYQCACRNLNCLECVAGVSNIMRAVGQATGSPVGSLNAALDRAQDDDRAVEPLRVAGEALGRAASMVLNLIDPARLVIYGPPELVNSEGKGALFIQEMQQSLAQYAFSTTKECLVELRPWNPDAIAIGAAFGALQVLGGFGQ